MRAFHAEKAMEKFLHTATRNAKASNDNSGSSTSPRSGTVATEVHDVAVSATVEQVHRQSQTENEASEDQLALLKKYLTLLEEREILRQETDKNVILRFKHLEMSMLWIRRSMVRSRMSFDFLNCSFSKPVLFVLQKFVVIGICFIALYLLLILLFSGLKLLVVKKTYSLRAW